MALDLKKLKDASSQVTVTVYYGDEELEFYAMRPTTEDRVQYRREVTKCFNRRGELDSEKLSRIQRRWAKRFLKGFREGDLVVDGKPLDPSDERWKEYLEEAAPEVLEGVTQRLFETDIEVSLRQ